jgi:hypothetical protein
LIETEDRQRSPRRGADAQSSEGFTVEKLHVNEIGPDGDVSTVGLFYSQAEARKIVDMLRANPDRTGYRYEIVEAVRHTLTEKRANRGATAQKE